MDAMRQVLTLDFPGHRTGSRISDLDLPGCGFRCQELFTRPLPAAVTGREYAAALLSEKGIHSERRDIDAPIGGVLAYCLAGPLAQEVGQLLRQSGRQPGRLVVFEPGVCSRQTIVDEYSTMLEQAGASSEDLAAAVEEIDARIGDPERLVEYCGDELRRRATAAFMREGFDRELVDSVVASSTDEYVAYLRYLVAAYNVTWPAWDGDVMLVLSVDRPEADASWGAEAPDVVRIRADADSLFTARETRDAVASFLARPLAT